VSPGLGQIWADELRFKQGLLNLLSNAVKFTPDGGRVGVTVRAAGDEVEVTVTDTGVGIAPADQERIFDSFQQGGRVNRSIEGTGLGLTLTRRIVELHGGRVWLTSRLGHGSTFSFTIPQNPTLATEGAGSDTCRRHRRAAGAAPTTDPRSSSSRTTPTPRSCCPCTWTPPGCGRCQSAAARTAWRRCAPCALPRSSSTSGSRAWTGGTSSPH
jgi:hypothetical protein